MLRAFALAPEKTTILAVSKRRLPNVIHTLSLPQKNPSGEEKNATKRKQETQSTQHSTSREICKSGVAVSEQANERTNEGTRSERQSQRAKWIPNNNRQHTQNSSALGVCMHSIFLIAKNVVNETGRIHKPKRRKRVKLLCYVSFHKHIPNVVWVFRSLHREPLKLVYHSFAQVVTKPSTVSMA